MIAIDEELCKGCGLCIDACPKNILEPKKGLSSKGYHPASVTDAGKCTGCGSCAVMCPDIAITME